MILLISTYSVFTHDAMSSEQRLLMGANRLPRAPMYPLFAVACPSLPKAAYVGGSWIVSIFSYYAFRRFFEYQFGRFRSFKCMVTSHAVLIYIYIYIYF